MLSKKQHAITTSWCLKKDSKLLGILSPAAFLVEIGKVLIAQQIMSDNTQDRFKEAIKSSATLEEAEREVTGVDTPEVSAKIFEHWRFEAGLVDTIRHCLNPQEANDEIKKPAQILHVVRTVVELNGTVTDESIAAAKKLIEKYSLTWRASIERCKIYNA
jgi:HD-like signal output (HDOD) protein